MRTSVSWEKYFGSTKPTEHTSPPNLLIKGSKGSNYIWNAEFFDLKVSGAIIFTSTNSETKLLIESVSFTSCSSESSDGGSVYFYLGGSCVQSKVCSTLSKSSGSSNNQHSSIYVTNDATHINYLEDSTIASSGTKGTGYGPIYQKYGLIHIESTNISKSKCYRFCGFMLRDPFSKCNVSFSTVSNNECSDYCCINLYSKQQHFMDHCNIVNNIVSKLAPYGIIYAQSSAELTIMTSCIMNNTGNIQYHSERGSITMINVSCDHLESTSGTVNAQSAGSKSFINFLHHFELGTCDSFYDSIGSLKPNIPAQTISDQQKRYQEIIYSYLPFSKHFITSLLFCLI